MSNVRRKITTVEIDSITTFDQQFWPVLVSLCILGGFLVGAFITIVEGPMKWVGLISLPILIASAIWVLQYVDSRLIRRSLQFAAVLSLAIHVLLVILAHYASIFSGYVEREEQSTAVQTLPRTIRLAVPVEDPVWEQVNEVTTPETTEPELEPTRTENNPTTPVQPVRAPESKPEYTQTNVQPRRAEETLPKQGAALSRPSRRKTSESIAAGKSRPSTSKSQPTETEKATSASEASSANVSRPSRIRDSVVEREDAPAMQLRKSNPAVNPNRESRRKSESASRRTDRPTDPQSQMAAPERPRAESESLATTQMNVRSPSRTESQPTDRTARSAPAEQNFELAKRSGERQFIRPTNAEMPEPRRSVSNEVARAQNRQPSERPSPATAVDPNPRPLRTERVAEQVTSPSSIEAPAMRSAASNPRSGQSTSEPVAMSKSEQGISGAGQTANISRDIGSNRGAAMRASDSARRSESTSAEPNRQSLIASQRAERPRAASAESIPRSALTQRNPSNANQTASQQPDQTSSDSAASVVARSTDATESNMSLEKGTAQIDLGPTKLVNEQRRGRASGGGQEIASTNSQSRVARPNPRGETSLPSVASEIRSAAATSPGRPSRAADDANAVSDSAASIVQNRSGETSPISGGPAAGSNSIVREPNTFSDSNTGSSTRRASPGDAPSNMADTQSSDARPSTRASEDRELIAGSSTADELPRTSRQNQAGGVDELAPSEQVESGGAEIAKRDASSLDRGTTDRGTVDSSGIELNLVESGQPRRSTGSADRNPDIAERSSNRRRARIEDRSDGLAVEPSPLASGSQSNQAPTPAESESSDAGESDSQFGIERRTVDAGSITASENPTGSVGPTNNLEVNPGVADRRAVADSPVVQTPNQSRFIRPDAGGPAELNPAPTIAREAFRGRNPNQLGNLGPQTERAIELGLEFLSRNQLAGGRWELSRFDAGDANSTMLFANPTAATGLAMLAFQGAGYHHKDYKYARLLTSSVQWMLEHQGDDGNLFVPDPSGSNVSSGLYSHGIASLALTEAYGMTQDPMLREPAQRAVDYIVESQDDDLGGWRYRPGKGSDTSVTGWMVMALQSARLSGLDVPERTWRGVDTWLASAKDIDDDHLFRYNPDAEDTDAKRHGRAPSKCMTAVGLLCHIYLDWERNDPRLDRGVEYLLEQMPDDSNTQLRDTYYWYYATQVIRHNGGDAWEQWKTELRPLLLNTQLQSGDMSGSWHPYRPVPDLWGRHGGRLYVTTMNLLSLEVDYRLLPLYEKTVEQ